MKLTKNFRIKTGNGFPEEEIINFLSESVYFRDGRNLDTRIQDEVDTLNGRVDTEVNTLTNKINSEVNTLNDRIDTEVTVLNNKFDHEVEVLNGAITRETGARENEIKRVEGLITAEQEARIAADETLTTNLSKETQNRVQAIAEEIKTRQEADKAINDKIGIVHTEKETLTESIAFNTQAIQLINTTTVPALSAMIYKETGDNAERIDVLDTSVANLIALIGGGSLEEGMETILTRLVTLEEKIAALENPPEEEPSEPEQTE